MKDFEGAADHISLILDGIRRESAVRCASAAAAEEQEKLQREQQIAGKTTNPSNRQEGKTLAGQQAGGSAAATATARSSAVARRMNMPGGARRDMDFVSKMCPEYPLFKALSAGEGGSMSTRAQSVVSVAFRLEVYRNLVGMVL